MVIDLSHIGKIVLIIVALVVFGYIFIAGFKGNSEEHGATSGKKSKGSNAAAPTTTDSTEKKG